MSKKQCIGRCPHCGHDEYDVFDYDMDVYDGGSIGLECTCCNPECKKSFEESYKLIYEWTTTGRNRDE